MAQKDNVLYVRFFGSFTMVWNEKPLMCANETQFACFMQMLLHNRERGLDRRQLMEELFWDRDVKDAAHSTHVLLYNIRRRLSAMGLPECEYIESRQGCFYWTSEIPVIEDAAEFEAAYRRAEVIPDEDEQLSYYLSASELYAGEFLPMRAGSLWASQEARRYQAMFEDCMNKAAALLRQRKDYTRLEKLARHATAVQPLSNWEELTLEALIALGRFEDAERLYRQTEQRYFEELRVRPNAHMLSLHEQIIIGGRPSQQMLEAIQEQLSGRRGRAPGAYLCSYPVFEGIYRMMERLTERGGQSVYLMQCFLTDSKGLPLSLAGVTEELRDRLEQVLCDSLRQTDVVCRYGENQYLVLLVNTTLEDCTIIQNRITARVQEADGIAVQYYVSSVYRR